MGAGFVSGKSCRMGFFLAVALFLAGAPPGFGATFHDALGRGIELRSTPKRIVSLAPNLTEILYYLGLGKRVVGVTRFSNYPPAASKKPDVGSYANVNVERIVELRPDLVFATADGNRPGVVTLLDQAGIPVYVVNPRTVKETIATIAAIADVCGVGEKGRHLASLLTRRVKNIVERTADLKRPTVFLQINIRPIMTVNNHTIHGDVIRLAGGRNMTGDLPVPYPTIGMEEVLAGKPDVIIITSMERGGRFEQARRNWYKWPSIPAVRQGRVYLVNSDFLDRPSPRIVEGLEMMARLIHPEVHWKSVMGDRLQ